jgi:hypothetical protein
MDKSNEFEMVPVAVQFCGTVEVRVPKTVPAERRRHLAEKLATARILATVQNMDAPEDDACGDYEEEFDLTEEKAGKEWDGCKIEGVNGLWSCVES